MKYHRVKIFNSPRLNISICIDSFLSKDVDNILLTGVNSANKNAKRKKFDSTSEDSWLKRRSSRVSLIK